jgi:hypothetical protein
MPFETSGNVDRCTEEVTTLVDHIAEMDADADLEARAFAAIR